MPKKLALTKVSRQARAFWGDELVAELLARLFSALAKL